ncbi:O-succinylbenzoic acid--CoA ligase [Robertkochia marina]|uniref:O-succinylbenzoic acid--CoA ligase n=1 Tax=Robertkochia marina TaxID=1227945 RepID=A0A4S3M173_9FLAO|nr:AMP-binding protein [Robertkochia marina]THD67777.1 O-succinylbenzoic acid--CoA ligase [Robertkochia marina]TRZ41747.1 O-succinylbenzoic acid--CoA ligase [Robertkochia marina]
MKLTYDKIHLKFRLNGHYFDREHLQEVAYSFVKEGKPFEKSVGDFLMDWLDHNDHITVTTSGSTGSPKTVRLKKQHMVNSALTSGDFFKITVGDSALHCLPADYIAGKMMLVRAMVLGLEIDLIEPTTNPMHGIEKRYDFAAMTPMQVQNSLSQLNQIKKLIVGGAPVSRELVESLQNKRTLVFETYGMTETVTHIAARQLNHFRNAEEVESSYFKVLPKVSIKKDERGCLVIDAPQISKETIVTNDLINIKEDDQFEWLGRYDNIINSGGIKLIPELIEEKFSQALEKRFFVCGVPDSELGDKLVMVIEDKNSRENEYWELLRKVEGLDKYEMPKTLLFTECFEETENGKVIRKSTLEKIIG